MEKHDFKRVMKPYWSPPVGRFELLEVPELLFLMVDGRGDPNTSGEYAHAVQWLYSVSYGLKFASKAAERDYGVSVLEGLWWAEDLADFEAGRRERWLWTMMIQQPEWTTQTGVESAVDKTRKKHGVPPASLRLERFAEGLSAQILHVGPYSAEAPTIARLHGEFLPAEGLVENGHHHEIYLGDPRRAAPEALRTILRQPVRRLSQAS